MSSILPFSGSTFFDEVSAGWPLSESTGFISNVLSSEAQLGQKEKVSAKLSLHAEQCLTIFPIFLASGNIASNNLFELLF